MWGNRQVASLQAGLSHSLRESEKARIRKGWNKERRRKEDKMHRCLYCASSLGRVLGARSWGAGGGSSEASCAATSLETLGVSGRPVSLKVLGALGRKTASKMEDVVSFPIFKVGRRED